MLGLGLPQPQQQPMPPPFGVRPSTNVEDWRGEDAKMFSPTPMAQDPSLGMAYTPPMVSGQAASSPMAQGAGVNDVDTAAARAMMHQPTEKVWRDLPPPAPYSGPALTPTGQLAPIPQGIMSNPAMDIMEGLEKPKLMANKQGEGSDMEGPYPPKGGYLGPYGEPHQPTPAEPYTPLTQEEHEGLMYDTPVVSSKGPNGGPTKEEVQEMLDTTQAEHDQHWNEMKREWGKSLLNPEPAPEGRIRGWKSIPGFQEYMKNLPPDVTVHDMKDGTIIFQKKRPPPVPTS